MLMGAYPEEAMFKGNCAGLFHTIRSYHYPESQQALGKTLLVIEMNGRNGSGQ